LIWRDLGYPAVLASDSSEFYSAPLQGYTVPLDKVEGFVKRHFSRGGA